MVHEKKKDVRYTLVEEVRHKLCYLKESYNVFKSRMENLHLWDSEGATNPVSSLFSLVNEFFIVQLIGIQYVWRYFLPCIEIIA